MPRYIDADKLQKRLYDSGLWNDSKAAFYEMINNQPTVDAVEDRCVAVEEGRLPEYPRYIFDGEKFIEKEKTVIKDSGDRTVFPSGAVRDMHENKGRCDLIPACALLRLARHFEAGAKKYGDNNWQKGIPTHSYLDSALRHIYKYSDGWTDEDHLIAAVWNLMCLAWTEEKLPEMVDVPCIKK